MLSFLMSCSHRHEQKDRKKMLAESPDHIEIDFDGTDCTLCVKM